MRAQGCAGSSTSTTTIHSSIHHMGRKVMVVGCGVIGLTTGLILLREGHSVTIITKASPPDTTSNAAGAFWYPVLDEPCSSLRNQLSLATFHYVHLHQHKEACVVERMIDVYYALELASAHEDAVCFSPTTYYCTSIGIKY